MTTTNLDYSSPVHKSFEKGSPKSWIIEINKGEAQVYYSFGRMGRGAQGLGRKNRVFQIYVDRDNRVYAGLTCKDRGGQFYRYVEFGTLKTSGEDV